MYIIITFKLTNHSMTNLYSTLSTVNIMCEIYLIYYTKWIKMFECCQMKSR